jgi:hypothetical protein
MEGDSAPLAEPLAGACSSGEHRHAGWAVYRRADGGDSAPKLYHHPKMQEFSWEAPASKDGPTMRVIKLRRGLNGRVGCEVRVVSFSDQSGARIMALIRNHTCQAGTQGAE